MKRLLCFLLLRHDWMGGHLPLVGRMMICRRCGELWTEPRT